MGRTVAVIWHASFSVAAGVLYFFFVLPRTFELVGDTSHALGTAMRIVAGALIGLAALPVVFTLLRTRKPELGTPSLALQLRTVAIVLHALAGVLVIGTAIAEIWLSLDTAGQWLFGIYGGAGALALLGVFAFYLAFAAELPPPPPKPLKVKQRTSRKRQKAGSPENAEDAGDAENTEPVQDTEPADETTEDTDKTPDVDEPATSDDETAEPKLRNRRPTDAGIVRGRRKRSGGGVAVDD